MSPFLPKFYRSGIINPRQVTFPPDWNQRSAGLGGGGMEADRKRKNPPPCRCFNLRNASPLRKPSSSPLLSLSSIAMFFWKPSLYFQGNLFRSALTGHRSRGSIEGGVGSVGPPLCHSRTCSSGPHRVFYRCRDCIAEKYRTPNQQKN